WRRGGGEWPDRTGSSAGRLFLLGMGRSVAGDALHGAIHQRLHLFLRVTLGIQEFLRGPVTPEAAHIRIGLGDLDGKLIRPGRVAPYVAEALELGLDRASEAVIRMTRVALALADVAVLEVRRREGVTLHVLEVLHEGRHHVARAARPHGRRLLQP